MKTWLAATWSVLKVALYGWIVALIKLIRLLCAVFRKRAAEARMNERDRKAAKTRCVPIRDPAFVRPNPLLYSQRWLSAHGFAVSWNNPDFALFRHSDGKPVGAHELEADTAYDVVVRVWNASVDCPVVEMPVHLSYLSFGVGTVSHAIATKKIDVGVIGGANNPALVSFPWTTPKDKGHYCLQALLDPVADVDFLNNLGQHNTDVVYTHSPGVFSFELRNDTAREHTYRFTFDQYEVGRPGPCEKQRPRPKAADERHRVLPPLPAGWSVALAPASPTLAAGAGVTVTATVTPPEGFTGEQTINIHARYTEDYTEHLAGGVTVRVKGGA